MAPAAGFYTATSSHIVALAARLVDMVGRDVVALAVALLRT